MKFLRKNQIIVYTIALMLVVAGYLNFTGSKDLTQTIQTTASEEELVEISNISNISNIGDAQLVSGSDIISSENSINNNNVISNTNSDVDKSNELNKNNYFTISKLERENMYSQMIETYEKILNSNNSVETQKQSATEKITEINNTKNKIMVCENLLKAKGFENSVIFVNDNSINIIVEAKELTKDKVAQIQNIVSRELESEVKNIHISNK